MFRQGTLSYKALQYNKNGINQSVNIILAVDILSNMEITLFIYAAIIKNKTIKTVVISEAVMTSGCHNRNGC